MATHKGVMPIPSSCPPREIGRFGRGLAWRAALIGPGLEPAFDDRQQTLKRVGHALLLKPGDLMAHLDLEGWGICLAPSHRRLRDPAIASWMADTAPTALPRSRRRTGVADNPLGSSPPDRKEVLHHRGRSDGAAPRLTSDWGNNRPNDVARTHTVGARSETPQIKSCP